MKKPEEIKKGIECCVPRWKGDHFATCREDCPYRPEGSFCRGALNKDNIEYIRQLESNASQVSKALCDKENATLEEMLEAVSQLKQKVNDRDLACLKLLRKTDKLLDDIEKQKAKVDWAHKRVLNLTIERNNLLRQLNERRPNEERNEVCQDADQLDDLVYGH